MAKDWPPGMCNEKSGFLFSHECFHPPAGQCSKCQKPVCEEHSHSDGGIVICTTCVRKSRQQDETTGRRGRQSHHDDHHPYFYGGYYAGYGYYGGSPFADRADPIDFTEADSENLAGEGDEGFENDMSAS
jgi:hypothetical protein